MGKDIVMGIDSANMFRLGAQQGRLYAEDAMRSLIRRCADAGVQTIYWRVSATGQVAYRSKVRTVIGSQPGLRPGFGFQWTAAETVILRQCDPPAVAVDEAHKLGLRIYGYITLFDEYHPGCESAFETAHPEFAWKHRVQDHHIRGLLCYAYPEVRAHRVAEVEELLGYGFDGVYLDLARTHCAVQPVFVMPLTGGDPYLQYGFNEPEVEEFRRRTGVDPRMANPADAPSATLDRSAYDRLRGEFLTQFLREVRARTADAGADLAVGFYTDAACYLSPAGRRGRVPMGTFYHDVDTWVAEDLVDAFVIIAEHRRYGARDWREHSEAQFAAARDKGIRVYLWAATEGSVDELDGYSGRLPVRAEKGPGLFYEALEAGIHQCLDASADGVYLYEAFHPEKVEGYWKHLTRILAR